MCFVNDYIFRQGGSKSICFTCQNMEAGFLPPDIAPGSPTRCLMRQSVQTHQPVYLQSLEVTCVTFFLQHTILPRGCNKGG